jgi:hypothetical protein
MLNGSSYAEDGFLLVRGGVDVEPLDTLEREILGLIAEWTGRTFTGLQDPDLATMLAGDRALEVKLYDGVRGYPWLQEFSSHPSVVDPVRPLLSGKFGLLGKIPLRMDLPLVTRELAVWHQDYFYVKGNTDIVTAWIPLQDTPYEVGCLMVMPGSHKLGVVPHDKPLLGKKFVPSTIFERPVHYVEMKRGDMLFFNSLLLHSSSLNLSNRLRWSVQARYSRIGDPIDPGMGEVTALQ